jgi:hypothetical protein
MISESAVPRDAKPEPLLMELAAEVMSNWRSAEMERRRQLWLRHFRREKTDKIPVKCAVYYTHDAVWRQLLPEDRIVFKEGLQREVEVHLRIKLTRFKLLRDDEVVWPHLTIGMNRRREAPPCWGVAVNVERTTDAGGAYRPLPMLKEESDLDKVQLPEPMPRPPEESLRMEQMRTLTGDVLPVVAYTDELHYGPYEWAVRMRGGEQLLYDVSDRPEWVHRLMDRITTGLEGYHRAREAAGVFDAVAELPQVHVPYAEIPDETRHALGAAWCYVHAQSSASLSPEMYAEFVQPYNARIARLFGRIYYHGCEDLGRKAAVIRDLPHLSYFHVSPWTRLTDVVPVLRDRPVVLEVHSPPQEVLFEYRREEMHNELRRRIARAQGMVFDLKLCDIQTIQGAEGQLERWTEIAMEESTR